MLRSVVRSLTSDATAALLHAFVTARLDHCYSFCVGLPLRRLWCLHPILRSAAHISRRNPKFDNVSSCMLDLIHILPAIQRMISLRIIALVLSGFEPASHEDLCSSALSPRGRCSLRPTEQI